MIQTTHQVSEADYGEFLIAAPGEPIVNITAYTARQQVSGYIGSQVSHMMGGGEPSLLLVQGRLVWRVPILLTSPQRGLLGNVGHLDVDARTGQLLITKDLVQDIEAHAQAVVANPTL